MPSEPALPMPLRAAVEAALRWAWQELLSTDPLLARSGEEEAITAFLWNAMNSYASGERLAPGLAGFETVGRGEKVNASDGRLNKQPDLTFRPIVVAPGVRNKSDWGLFVECKIIASSSHHSPSQYGENGVRRFASGEYAHRMSDALMVAYVRDGRRPHPALGSVLVGRYSTLSHAPGATSDRSTSRHGRDALEPPRVDIDLVHLWLAVD